MGEFGTLNFSVGFKKTSAFPLDADGYFTSLEDAKLAASTAVEPGSADSVYYIGQTLTVVEGENSTQYIIQPDKTLKNTSSEDVYISNTPPLSGDYKLFVDTDEEAESVEIYTKLESDSKFALKVELDKVSFIKNLDEEAPLPETVAADTATKTLLDWNGNNIVDTYATKVDLNSKQDTLVSGTSIKTINNQKLLGLGNITFKEGIDPDEEDITNTDNKLKLADRSYNPDTFSGKGYKILRRNIIDGKNTLTKDMINLENTIYEIRYDFDLQELEIIIPEGCTLKFNGGNLQNGILNGTDTYIENINININVQYKGNFKNINNTIIYDNLSELKNSNINLPGFNVCTLGYYEKNDGGAADYFIINKDDTYTPDLGSCIELNNGKYAILVAKNGEVNVLQFGAKSCNYWSNFYDSTKNLQDALNYVSNVPQTTDITKINYKVGRLLINGLFFTKELTLTSNNNIKIEIVGYNAYTSLLIYIGDSGYNGDGMNFDTDSYILKVNANYQFSILNIGFIGILNHKDESKLKTIASYGLIIENYYDWGSRIEGCKFQYFVMSGLYINCWLLNGYLLNNRWDVAGKNYIYIKDVTALKISNFTVDTKFHGFLSKNNTFKRLFTSIDWCKDIDNSGDPILGHSIIYFENTKPNAVIQIDTARVEGHYLVDLDNSFSSFISIKNCTQLKYNYKSYINISSINFALEKIHSIIKLITDDINVNPRLNITGINSSDIGQVIPIYYESINNPNLNKLYAGTQKTPIAYSTLYISKEIENQGSPSTNTFVFNGMQFGVQYNIEEAGYFKYNDIVFNTSLLNGTQRSDKYNCIGYSCIRPLKGYGNNVANAWFPTTFEATLNSDRTITTNKELMVNVSYTVIYNDDTEQDICCTESKLQEDGTYLNKFEYDTINKDTQTITMLETKCEWRPFGRRELAANPGTLLNRPTTNLINGDKYINTDTKRETVYINGKWYNPDGLEESINNTGTFIQKPTSSKNIPIGFQYFCTDKQTSEGLRNGIIIYYAGDDVWVDALGRVVQ